MSNDDITITAEGIEITANEQVSTGDYETGSVGAVLEASVEGADLTDGIPDELKNRIYALQRTLQGVSKEAGKQRRAEALDKAAEERAGDGGGGS